MSDNELAPYYGDQVPLEIHQDTPEQYDVTESEGGDLAGWEAHYVQHPDGHQVTSRGDVGTVLDTAEAVFDLIAPETQEFLLSLTDGAGQPLLLHPRIVALAFDLAEELGGAAPQQKVLHSGGGLRSMLADLMQQQDQAQRMGDHQEAQAIQRQIENVAERIR